MPAIPIGVSAFNFDMWGTLISGNHEFAVARLRLISRLLGLGSFTDEQLWNVYLQADLYFNARSENEGIHYGLPHRLVSMYESLGIRTSVPGDSALDSIQSEVGRLRLEARYMPTFIEPDAPETLQALIDQGYALGLLSNTGMDSQLGLEPVLRKLGIWRLFKSVIFSSEDSRAKPNSMLFHDACYALNEEPEAVLHVGDRESADYPAKHAGLHAFLFDPTGRSALPHIRSLKELLDR